MLSGHKNVVHLQHSWHSMQSFCWEFIVSFMLFFVAYGAYLNKHFFACQVFSPKKSQKVIFSLDISKMGMLEMKI